MKNTEVSFEGEFLRFLKCLQEADCLDEIIIIGSWAEYLYDKCNVIENYEAKIQTIDLDVLIPEVNRNKQKLPLIEICKREGYIYDEDRITGASRLIGRENFEIEFLTPQVGDGTRKIPRTKLGVNAQQISHLSLLKKYTIKISFNGMKIRVPTPEAYVLQKMVVNEMRGIKAKKDRLHIERIMPHLDDIKLNECKTNLTKKESTMFSRYNSGTYQSEQKVLNATDNTPDKKTNSKKKSPHRSKR